MCHPLTLSVKITLLRQITDMKSFLLLLLFPLLALVSGNKDVQQCNKVGEEFNQCTKK